MRTDTPVGTVTFLFSDIEGSTRLWERHPEAMRPVLARHDALLREAIETNGGRVVKQTGDGCYAAFESAVSAAGAALAAQQALIAEGWGEIQPQIVRARMALHTGEAEIRAGDYFGPTLNRAARLMSVGHGGQVLLSASTQELVRDDLPAGATLLDLGEHRLKDLSRPERIFQLTHPSLPATFPPLTSLDTYPNNLPAQLTSFVGREREIEEVKQLLAKSRLVTLTGSGGTGKTRLSLQVAAELLPNYADGTWLVELSSLADPVLVIHSVGSVFRLQAAPDQPLINNVIDFLRRKRLLLILDNCEHLIDACARLADALLRACAGVQIMTSSREALGIAGEAAYRVPSLSLPSDAPSSADALLPYESVQLFVERAMAANSRFTLNQRSAPAVAQICRRLDGIPLAIELAAARAKVFSAEQIAARLDDRFRLLTGGSRTALPRQQTLRAMIDWSYDLLLEPERYLLRRLSVFMGGWTFESAEAVCPELDVLELLPQLVNKSLVIVEEQQGDARYHLLETIRQYARDRLLAAGEVIAARDRHLDYFMRLSERAEPGLRGAEVFEWIERLDPDTDNIKAALVWGAEMRPEDALALVGNLFFLWPLRLTNWGAQDEGGNWLRDLCRRVNALPPLAGEAANRRTSTFAKALLALSLLALEQGKYADSFKWLEQVIPLARMLDDPFLLALTLGEWAGAIAQSGDGPAALGAADESEALFKSLGEDQWLAIVVPARVVLAARLGHVVEHRRLHDEARRLINRVNQPLLLPTLVTLGMEAREAGDMESARVYFQAGAKIALHFKSRLFEVTIRSELVHVDRLMGHLQEAKDGYRKTIVEWLNLGHRAAVAHQLACIAYLVRAEGESPRAACLLGAAEALRDSIGMPMLDVERQEFDGEVQALRESLTGDQFASAWAEGRNLDIEHAVAYALSPPLLTALSPI